RPSPWLVASLLVCPSPKSGRGTVLVIPSAARNLGSVLRSLATLGMTAVCSPLSRNWERGAGGVRASLYRATPSSLAITISPEASGERRPTKDAGAPGPRAGRPRVRPQRLGLGVEEETGQVQRIARVQ